MVRLVRIMALLLVLFAAFAISARYVLHGHVTAARLAVTVSDQSGSAGSLLDYDGNCRELEMPRAWRCTVLDGGGSGGVDYLVHMRGDSSCFDATRTTRDLEGGTRKHFGGCVFLWQWSLLSIL